MNHFWDEKYSTDEYVYGRNPNLFFHDQLALISPGNLLLPGEGEGRNAVYAAGKGWHVTAFDQSPVARSKAMKLAREYGVEIRYGVYGVEQMEFEPASFDAIALLFFHLPEMVRKSFHEKLIGLLRPGGWIIGEFFHVSQLGNLSGGPKISELLYTSEELAEDFGRLDIKILDEKREDLHEGPAHSGMASVISLLARKMI